MHPASTIVTLTLNPAIDYTARVPHFCSGEVNRANAEQFDAGGKGVNVASFLTHFDHAVIATGLMGEENADTFEHLFDGKGIESRFIKIPGRTRINVKIFDPKGDEMTDINFRGLEAPLSSLNEVTRQMHTLADDGYEHFVLAGSLPSGVPADYYHDLIAMLKHRGKQVYLDTSGGALAYSVRARPTVVKPNIRELSEITNRAIQSKEEVVEAARALSDGQIDLVAVSMGSEGAVFVTYDRAVLATPPKMEVRSTVGAGDAMVSGIVHARLQDLELTELARIATGFSLGALEEVGPHLPSKDIVERLAADVTVADLHL